MTVSPMVIDCEELTTREINAQLQSAEAGSSFELCNVKGRHNLAVGLHRPIEVTLDGDAGYYIGGLGAEADVTVNGSVGWGPGENLMSGTVRVRGHASQSVGATARGGLVQVDGSAGARAAASLKGGTVAVGGDVGHAAAFMAQAGVLLVCGDTGSGLGDSIYEAVVYVGGSIGSLGVDAQIEELDADDIALVTSLLRDTGFDHRRAEDFTKVASARELYHFTTANHARY